LHNLPEPNYTAFNGPILQSFLVSWFLKSGGVAMGESQVRVDTVHNRLYVMLAGDLSDEETKHACRAILAAARKLDPGFAVITDITQFLAATAVGVSEIRRTQAALSALGVSRVIRVVGSRVAADRQLTRSAQRAGFLAGSSAEYARSVDEAETILSH
jgi:hypothetical protein